MKAQAFAIHEGQNASKKPILDMISSSIYQHFDIK